MALHSAAVSAEHKALPALKVLAGAFACLVLAALIALLPAARAHAAQDSPALTQVEAGWLEDNPQLTVGYVLDYMPFCGQSAAGEVEGLLPTLFESEESPFATAGTRIVYKPYETYGAMMEAFRAGEIQVAFPLYESAEVAKEESAALTSSFGSVLTDMVYLDEVSPEDVETIAISSHSPMQLYYAREHFPNAAIVERASALDCCAAVARGEVQVTLLTNFRTQTLLSSSSAYDSLHFITLPASTALCMAVHPGDDALLGLLDLTVSALSTGEFNRIVTDYAIASQRTTHADLVRSYAPVIAVVLGALLLLAVATVVLLMARRRLNRALAAEQQASNAKSVFLSSISHDIRTPMNAVVGYGHAILRNADDPEKVRSYATKLLTSGRHLLNLINDVLDLSSIESGKLTVLRGSCDLRASMRELDVIFGDNARSKGVAFCIDAQITHPYVFADQIKLDQVLVNITNNALKFTPQGGSVRVTVRQEPSAKGQQWARCSFAVADTGIGMSAELMGRIFQPFERARSSVKEGVEGTGLGLAITKRIVDAMDGELAVESEEGVGSTFTVTLDLELDSSRSITSPAEPRPSTSDAREKLRGVTVLLAEDNEMNLEIALMVLEQAEIRAITARNGREAVETVRASEPGTIDAVLMDLQMPVMDGFEAACAIRALPHPDAASLPIIALTASVFTEDRERAFEAGMGGFATKPLNPSELYEVLAAQIGA